MGSGLEFLLFFVFSVVFGFLEVFGSYVMEKPGKTYEENKENKKQNDRLQPRRSSPSQYFLLLPSFVFSSFFVSLAENLERPVRK